MIGIVLEGGGTRGAYEIGAVQALLENGYEIGAVTGTSIGAINGAMIAAGKFAELKALYETIEPDKIIDADPGILELLARQTIDTKHVGEYGRMMLETIRQGGFDITPLRTLLEANVDEASLRRSKIRYGLVFVDLIERKSKELLLEEIPEGSLIDCILASAYLPVFKADKRQFLDGGFANNIPLDLMLRSGKLDHIFVIRTRSMGIKQSLERDVPMTVIEPSEPLGPILQIDKDKIKENMQLGYFDTQRLLNGYKGTRYVIDSIPEDYFLHFFADLPEQAIREVAQLTRPTEVPHPKRHLFEVTLPTLEKLLDLKNAGYEEIGLALFEAFAAIQKLDRYKIYPFAQFVQEIRQSAANTDMAEPMINLFDRVNLYLAKTVRLSLSDAQEIIKAIMIIFLGERNGSNQEVRSGDAGPLF